MDLKMLVKQDQVKYGSIFFSTTLMEQISNSNSVLFSMSEYNMKILSRISRPYVNTAKRRIYR